MKTLQDNTKREATLYTPQQVLDSLDFREVDHDGDFDGNIHLVSDLDGSSTKIPFNKLEYFKGNTKN